MLRRYLPVHYLNRRAESRELTKLRKIGAAGYEVCMNTLEIWILVTAPNYEKKVQRPLK